MNYLGEFNVITKVSEDYLFVFNVILKDNVKFEVTLFVGEEVKVDVMLSQTKELI